MAPVLKVNTSNPGKLAEYREYLGQDIQIESLDLKEPDADALTIIRYKASQFQGVIVDDVSLLIEGEEVGTHIKWYLDKLDQFVGKRADFVCYLGIHRHQKVEVFIGRVKGDLVEPRGNGFGFNNYFLPIGSMKTLGEVIKPVFNPRYFAIQKFLRNEPDHSLAPLAEWQGDFQ